MAVCMFCAEETILFDCGVPMCVTCSDLPKAGREERMRRRKAAQQQSSHQTEDDTRSQSG
jgi:hypothetical protein